MFHVTPVENLGSILSTGLQPRIGERSLELGEPVPRIYLFPTLRDCNDALSQWLGDWFNDLEEEEGKPMDLAVIEIDPAYLSDKSMESEVPWETSIADVIPPDAIVRVMTEYEVGRESAELTA